MLEREAGKPSGQATTTMTNRTPPPLLCPRPCFTLLPHPHPHTHTQPLWRQLQMELEIMQLEICLARCCVKTPERVPPPAGLPCALPCSPSLCIEIQNKNLQVENRCIEKRNPTTSYTPYTARQKKKKKGVTMLNKSELCVAGNRLIGYAIRRSWAQFKIPFSNQLRQRMLNPCPPPSLD